jgi:uncharacterized protein (DUF1778 family)
MTSSVLSIRVSSEERALLEAASGDAHTSLSDFVRRRALEAAEVDFLERRIVTARDTPAHFYCSRCGPPYGPPIKSAALV